MSSSESNQPYSKGASMFLCNLREQLESLQPLNRQQWILLKSVKEWEKSIWKSNGHIFDRGTIKKFEITFGISPEKKPRQKSPIFMILHLGKTVFSRLPTKTKFADAILLFVCKPDDAEVAAGDLFEELEKVKARHGSWYCNLWFAWELTLLVVAKGRKRFTKSVFGPLFDMLKRKSS